jgi:hypothetical protein
VSPNNAWRRAVDLYGPLVVSAVVFPDGSMTVRLAGGAVETVGADGRPQPAPWERRLIRRAGLRRRAGRHGMPGPGGAGVT